MLENCRTIAYRSIGCNKDGIMTSRDFCFWLQGYFELSRESPLSDEQVKKIQSHLALVFRHEIDPSMGDAAHLAGLDAIHGPGGIKIGGEVQTPAGPLKYRC